MEQQNLASNNDEISFADLVGFFWRYRVTFTVSMLLSAVVAGAMLLCVGLLAPENKLASLPFRVLFEGASESEYPNGLKYNPSDIIDAPVLQQVYEKNKLSGYLSFDEFKGSVFVSETNNALALLDKAYQDSLSNDKLSLIDRQSIEAEYRSKRQALRNQSYELRFLSQTRMFSIPEHLIDKVLKDILSTWAQLADSKKGVFKYRLALYTKNIFSQESLGKEDYIVGIDIMNSTIGHILDNIAKIELLPGADITRVGDDRIGLLEIKANLLNTRKYKLDPLVGLIRKTGLSKKPQLALLYLENQLFQLKLDQEQSLNNIGVFEDTLNFYLEKNAKTNSGEYRNLSASSSDEKIASLNTNYIPQFGDSFLDRIVEMSTQGNDVQYRQALTSRIVDEGVELSEMKKKSLYYQSLVEAMKNNQSAEEKNIQEIVDFIKERFAEIENDVTVFLEQIEAVYNAISKNQLRPETELYLISDPMFVVDNGGFINKKILLGGVLIFMLTIGLTIVGCLLFDYYKTRSRGSMN